RTRHQKRFRFSSSRQPPNVGIVHCSREHQPIRLRRHGWISSALRGDLQATRLSTGHVDAEEEVPLRCQRTGAIDHRAPVPAPAPPYHEIVYSRELSRLALGKIMRIQLHDPDVAVRGLSRAAARGKG